MTKVVYKDSQGIELIGGEYLIFDRSMYSHAAIYVGNGRVIHFSGEPSGGKESAAIREDLLEDVVNGCYFKVYRSPATELERNTVIDRARHEKDNQTKPYKLFSNNCQHFCSRCYGLSGSFGVNTLYNTLWGCLAFFVGSCWVLRKWVKGMGLAFLLVVLLLVALVVVLLYYCLHCLQYM